MVYGVNVSKCFKHVRTIQITIVFKSRIQIRWFVEIMLCKDLNNLEPFKSSLFLNQEYKLDGLSSEF